MSTGAAESGRASRPRGGVLDPRRLSIGLQLPVQAQSTRFAQPWETIAGPDELRAVAQAADRAGLAYVAVCDHVAIPATELDEMRATWFDTVATLGWLAAHTTQIRLLSHVWVLPYRHPLQTAKAFGTLDALSGGRVLLGVGAGHVRGEFDALGVPFAQRGALLDEGIDAVRAAMREGPASFHGDTWSFEGMEVAPSATRDGGVPIWVGGSSQAALRRAAHRGDGWLPQGRPEGGLRAAIDWIRTERERVHGPGLPIDIGAHAGFIYLGSSPNDLGDAEVSGSGEQVAHALQRLSSLGVQHAQVMFRTRSVEEMCEQIEQFGTEVVPLLEEGS